MAARLGITLMWPGGSFAATTVLMLLSSRFGKLRARDRLLDALALRGDEVVLDVGCGHGLMLSAPQNDSRPDVPLARPLVANRSTRQQCRCASAPMPLREGVADRVSVKRRRHAPCFPFEDATIDVVVSSLAIHNVPTSADRAVLPMREIARVVRPGGRAVHPSTSHTWATTHACFATTGWSDRAKRLYAVDLSADPRVDCAKAGVSLELRAVDRWHRGFPRIMRICADHHYRHATYSFQKSPLTFSDRRDVSISWHVGLLLFAEIRKITVG